MKNIVQEAQKLLKGMDSEAFGHDWQVGLPVGEPEYYPVQIQLENISRDVWTIGWTCKSEDAQFIAAAPKMVRGLLERIGELEQERDAALERVRGIL